MHLQKIIVWLLMKVHCAVGLIFFSQILSYHYYPPHKVPFPATQMYLFFSYIFYYFIVSLQPWTQTFAVILLQWNSYLKCYKIIYFCGSSQMISPNTRLWVMHMNVWNVHQHQQNKYNNNNNSVFKLWL